MCAFMRGSCFMWSRILKILQGILHGCWAVNWGGCCGSHCEIGELHWITKTDYNNLQTLCLCKAKKHFVFMVVIKAHEKHFNLLFQHYFASGHKMKLGRGVGVGGKAKKKADPTGISQTLCNYRHCRPFPFGSCINTASEKLLSKALKGI